MKPANEWKDDPADGEEDHRGDLQRGEAPSSLRWVLRRPRMGVPFDRRSAWSGGRLKATIAGVCAPTPYGARIPNLIWLSVDFATTYNSMPARYSLETFTRSKSPCSHAMKSPSATHPPA